jgi:PEP-CTERM motif
MRLPLLAVALVVVSPLALHADTTLFSTSFEAPTYNPGPAAGQGPLIQFSGSSGTIETGVVHTGTQAIEFNAATDTSTFAGGQSIIGVGVPFTATPSDETVDLQMSAEFTSATAGTNYDILGVFSSEGFLDQLEYLNGEVFLGSNTANQVAVSAGVWNTYGLHIDYSTDTFTAIVNGQALLSSQFSNTNTGIQNIFFGINSLAGNDAGYFDDLSVTTNPTSPVPEPSSLALLGTSALALMAAGRRKLLAR